MLICVASLTSRPSQREEYLLHEKDLKKSIPPSPTNSITPRLYSFPNPVRGHAALLQI